MPRFQISNTLFKLLYLVFGLFVVAGLLYVLWALMLARAPLFTWSQVHVYFLVFGELLAATLLYDVYTRFIRKGKGKNIWPVLLIYFILSIVVLILLGNYYTHPERRNYQSVQLLLKLMPFAWVIIGGGTLFALGKVLQNQFSYAWYSDPFTETPEPKNNSISSSWLIVGSFFVIGLIIRLVNLDGFPPYVDEYITTHFVYQLIHGAPFEWERAFPTTILPVLVSSKVFGINLWSARFPMIIINMLSIVPLYFLGKKIHRKIGLISVALYTLNPWIIAVSRTIREYAVLPLYYFISALFLLDLLEWENTTLKKYLKQNSWKIFILLLILSNSLYDNQSIIKIVIINFGIFGVLLLLKVLKTKTPLLVKVASVGASTLVFVLLAIISNLTKRLFENGQMILEAEDRYISLLTTNHNQHWFSLFPQVAWLVIAVATFYAIRAVFRKYNPKDSIVLYCYLVFLSILTFLTFFLVNPHLPARVRYGILLEYWYVIPVALAVFLVYRLANKIFNHKPILQIILLVVLGLSLLNFSSISDVVAYQGGGAQKVTGEKHYVVDPAYRFMLTQLNPGDVLLNDVLVPYDELFKKQFGEVIVFSYIGTIMRQDVTVQEFITWYPEGWIVLTQNSRLSTNGLVFENTIVDGVALDYLGRWGECYIWHWKPSPD